MSDLNQIQSISQQTLKRMPRYLNYLKNCQDEKIEFISASQISRDLNIQHTLVRKDLALTGVQGVPKIGHEVQVLVRAITDFLGWNNNQVAFLVGMGHLGKAICGYEGFKNVGIKTMAAFDIDPEVVGINIHGIEVYHLKKFKNLAQRMHIKIGIITVPAEFAQEIADLMVESGIEAIWNFCPVELKLPENIIVENMDIYASLGVLSRKLKEKNEQK